MKTFMIALLTTCFLGAFEPLAAQDRFEKADYDGNDILRFSEIAAIIPAITRTTFDEVDQNADGFLDYEEYSLGYAQGFLRPRRLPKPINLTVIKGNKSPGS